MAPISAGVLGLLSALAISTVSGHDTVCTYIYNQTCIDAVKDMMVDRSKFWFGTDFQVNCPVPGGMGGCSNARANFNDSLITRMTQNNDATADSIVFGVNVTYTLPAKRSYMGCGARIHINKDEVTYKKIDPLSGHRVYAFDASGEPSVTWPSTEGVNYTVIYYDVGSLILHGIYVNVNGGSISLGEVALSHRGPKNTLARKNPYVWAVFEQENHIVVSQVEQYLNSNENFTGQVNLGPLLTHFNLTGPLGINTVRAVGDEYSAHFMRSRNVFNRCPMYRQKRLQDHVNKLGGLTFNLSSSVATKSIDLHFVSRPKSYMLCCKLHNLDKLDKMLNFKKESEAMGSQTRDKPMIQIVPEMMRDNLQDKNFTLMIVDPTAEFNTSTNKAVVHWLVVNIPGKNVTSGTEVLKYHPLAPGKMEKMYLVLLYKQTGTSEDLKDINEFSGNDCPRPLEKRCMFKVQNYVEKNSLTLDGISALKVKADDYGKHRQIMDKVMMEKDVCKGKDGYADPCPTGSASVLKSSRILSVLMLMAVLAWF